MLIDHICDDCRAHFNKVLTGLSSIGIESELDPRLVRGFDYYTRTTFEFIAEALEGAQNAVGGGGRYDKLAEDLGGKPTSGIGFGIGIERLVLAREAEGERGDLVKRTLDVFVVDTSGDVAVMALVDELRRAGLAVDRAYDARSMKAQMRVADKSGARLAVIVRPQELAAGQVTMRDLRGEDDQHSVAREGVVAAIRERLTKS